MKKIMFKDKYGLTDAVLQGRKTMTRRIVGNRMTEDDIRAYLKGYTELANKCAQYKIGEVVAVAQSYKDAGIDPHFLMFQPIKGSTYFAEMEIEAMFTGGWNNKMFVRADLMPHQIRITDINVERLQDISDEDCMNEGVLWDYGDYPNMSRKVYLINDYEAFPTPRAAFASLINRVCGKSTWECNSYVAAYTFELVK